MRIKLAAALVLSLWASVAGAQTPSANGLSPTGNASATTVQPTGVSAPYVATLAAIAAQQGVLLDTFKQSGDADDTASLTRAVAAGVPILLGARTYTINNFSTGVVAQFIMRGIPGASIIQRTSASGSQFFQIQAATVYLDGLTFDMNKAAVTANQWGVFLNTGGQTVVVRNSVFKNNSGTLGTDFALISTGPAAGGAFYFEGDEFTGSTALSALFLGSVAHGKVVNASIHDNSGQGMSVGSYLAASSTNYSTDIIVEASHVYRNTGIGIAVGGFAAPYAYGTPQATYVSLLGNHLWDNGNGTSYEVQIQGDYLSAQNDTIYKSAITVFGGIDCNSRWATIQGEVVNLSGAGFGIDSGASIQAVVQNNVITMTAGAAINNGANQNSVYSGNKLILSGTASGMTIFATETDGNGNPFTTLASGTLIEGNEFDITGSGATGISIYDDAGGLPGATPYLVLRNKFNVSGSGSGAFQDIFWRGAPGSLVIDGNLHNGENYLFVDPTGSGDVLFDWVYLGGTIQGISSTTNVRSIVSSFVSNNGAGAGVLWVYPTGGSSGSSYTAATTLAASGSGGGSGWVGTPLIYNGAIIGVRTTVIGTTYSGTITVTATDSGGGSGATFVVGNVPGVPAYSTITYVSAAIHLLQKNGGFITLNTNPYEMDATTIISLKASTSGVLWRVLNATLPTFTVATLPACGSTSKGAWVIVSDAAVPVYNTTMTGSGTSFARAPCDGTNWLAH